MTEHYNLCCADVVEDPLQEAALEELLLEV